MKNNFIPVLLSGNSLVKNESFGSVEDMIPFVMLRSDKQQALEELRINAVYRLASGFTTTTWRTYVCDRSMGKKFPVGHYTSNPVGIAELKQMEHLLDTCDYIKSQIEELTTQKHVDRMEDFLDGFDKEDLLNELLPLSDAEFCRCIYKHYKAGHFIKGIQGKKLRDLLLLHFSDVPAREMIGAVFCDGYNVPLFTRKPKKPVTRFRIDK